MSSIVLSHVEKYYGQAHILKDLSLSIEDGEFMTLLGPSGCGKTTTLRVIAGLENPQQGTIAIDGKTVVDCDDQLMLPPAKRNLDLVFQSYALWPHLSVYENVAFGLKLKKLPLDEIQQRTRKALERMQILQFSERYPNELSGGQQQRVAIARAIVSESSILLLDEPLSNLDAKLRIEMRSELKRLHRELKTTVVYVTHDQTEALTLSTRIAVFFEGILVQCDKPMSVYRNPATLQVADFIGNPKINMINGTMKETAAGIQITSALGEVVLGNAHKRRNILEQMGILGKLTSDEVVMAIRPEHLQILPKTHGESPVQTFSASVYSELPAGSETIIQLDVTDTLQLMAKCIGNISIEAGQQVSLGIDTECINVFDAKTGKIVLGI